MCDIIQLCLRLYKAIVLRPIYIYIYIYRLACATFLIFVLSLITISGLTFNSSNTFAANSASIDANVNIRDSLTLNITRNGAPTSNVTLNLDPASNPFSYQDLDIAVGTNNETGYVLNMSATNTNLVNVADNTKTIPTLSTGTSITETEFRNCTTSDCLNKWGYSKDSGNYIPFKNIELLSNSERTNNDHTTLRFATKIDYTKPSGQYETNLIFEATANPLLDVMQDLNSALCTTSGPLAVIDSRDNQKYYVQRLADGNCWMLNNLRLGQDKSTTDIIYLNNTDSDVNGSFELKGKLSDGIFISTTIDNINDVNDSSQYYCTTDYGCYYNWFTSTAGVGDHTTTSGNVNYSICPKGWTLPTQTQFTSLSTAYNNSATALLVNPTNLPENANGANAPGLLLGGAYGSSGPNLVGSHGFYWSSTPYPAPQYGYILYHNTSTVFLGNGHYKYAGNAVRCLLK